MSHTLLLLLKGGEGDCNMMERRETSAEFEVAKSLSMMKKTYMTRMVLPTNGSNRSRSASESENDDADTASCSGSTRSLSPSSHRGKAKDPDKGRRSNFPNKLHALMQYATVEKPNDFKHLVAWSDDGLSFDVLDREAFMTELGRQFFPQQSCFRALERQLNIWGFIRGEGPEPPPSPPPPAQERRKWKKPKKLCALRFFNPYFQRDRPELRHRIQRTPNSFKKKKKSEEGKAKASRSQAKTKMKSGTGAKIKKIEKRTEPSSYPARPIFILPAVALPTDNKVAPPPAAAGASVLPAVALPTDNKVAPPSAAAAASVLPTAALPTDNKVAPPPAEASALPAAALPTDNKVAPPPRAVSPKANPTASSARAITRTKSATDAKTKKIEKRTESSSPTAKHPLKLPAAALSTDKKVAPPPRAVSPKAKVTASSARRRTLPLHGDRSQKTALVNQKKPSDALVRDHDADGFENGMGRGKRMLRSSQREGLENGMGRGKRRRRTMMDDISRVGVEPDD